MSNHVHSERTSAPASKKSTKPVTLTPIEHEALTFLKKHKRVASGMFRNAYENEGLSTNVKAAVFGRLVNKGVARECSSGAIAWVLVEEAVK